MRLFMIAALLAAALPASHPAWAATPGAWAALDTAARKSCERDIIRQAKRARVRAVEGKVLGIGAARDEDRFYGLLLRGDTAGFASRWLCLYDKRARTATAREISDR